MNLSSLRWDTFPKEKFNSFEKAVRNSLKQQSHTGSFLQDVCSLIERLASEENYVYQFYILTIVRQARENKIDWEIKGCTGQDLSGRKEYLSLKNVHLITRDESGVIEIN